MYENKTIRFGSIYVDGVDVVDLLAVGALIFSFVYFVTY
jgi:hypothetical protein